jgi:hypothetical protein
MNGDFFFNHHLLFHFRFFTMPPKKRGPPGKKDGDDPQSPPKKKPTPKAPRAAPLAPGMMQVVMLLSYIIIYNPLQLFQYAFFIYFTFVFKVKGL